jgi:peptidoglycan/xylan/chitin deacetylase (PgdA/CDA1 family)
VEFGFHRRIQEVLIRHGIMLTIVIYHYVRDIRTSRHPGIKGLELADFDGQLDYLSKHYRIINWDDVRTAASAKQELPRNACLLTFDDGFSDHYRNVYPRLVKRGITGSFFPSAAPLDGKKVLDVHKIHFTLAAVSDQAGLVKEVLGMIKAWRKDNDIPSDADLLAKYAKQGKYDPPDTVFLKKILQRGLPELVRASIINELFGRHVSQDESAFSRELYMDLDQLREMVRHGMEVGGHGSDHVWLDALPDEAQEKEIRQTVALLSRIYDKVPSGWVMSYPYGGHNDKTVSLLRNAGCGFGMTVDIGLDDLADTYRMKRLDTTKLPFRGDAEMCEYTRKVCC